MQILEEDLTSSECSPQSRALVACVILSILLLMTHYTRKKNAIYAFSFGLPLFPKVWIIQLVYLQFSLREYGDITGFVHLELKH